MFSNLYFKTFDIFQPFQVVTTFFEIYYTIYFYLNLIISLKHYFLADDAFFCVFFMF